MDLRLGCRVCRLLRHELRRPCPQWPSEPSVPCWTKPRPTLGRPEGCCRRVSIRHDARVQRDIAAQGLDRIRSNTQTKALQGRRKRAGMDFQKGSDVTGTLAVKSSLSGPCT